MPNQTRAPFDPNAPRKPRKPGLGAKVIVGLHELLESTPASFVTSYERGAAIRYIQKLIAYSETETAKERRERNRATVARHRAKRKGV